MKSKLLERVLLAASISLVSVNTDSYANIVPDKSLKKESSVVSNNNKKKTITGGAKRGSALFHSFSKFNVRKGSAAYFTSQPGIRNIISRITGNSESRINGILGVEGNANLFFINPNGIIFGHGAKLDLNGSFTATTASSIEFGKYSYSALNKNQVPLIKLNVPTGLSFKTKPSKIIVRGEGHNITQAGNVIAPNRGVGQSQTGLRVNPGKTISLLAGDIVLSGGLITAPSGYINLASINTGSVSFTQGFKGLDYSLVTKFGNITFERQALADSSGLEKGFISVFGNKITFKDASLVINSNLGSQTGGLITINAKDTLNILGESRFNKPLANGRLISRGIISQTFDGDGSVIRVNAKKIYVDQSGAIIATTFGKGVGGNLHLDADEFTIAGSSGLSISSLGSLILTSSAGPGQAGNIFVDSDKLLLKEGGFLASTTFSDGNGGNLYVNSRSITVDGGILIPEKDAFIPSLIGTTTTSSGQGGNLFIRTSSLEVNNGGRIDASTFEGGLAGSINIKADNITLSGRAPGEIGLQNPSAINSSGSKTSAFFSGILLVDLTLTGSAGDISINSDKITISDGAEITVGNVGKGSAGKLSINTGLLSLEGGTITASNNGGGGGTIDILSDILFMQGSTITATSKQSAPGGNIQIESDYLVGDVTSKIQANAEQSFGGNVNIEADVTLFPLENITASSELGTNFDGSIKINSNNFEFDPSTLPTIQPVDQIAPFTCSPSDALVKPEYSEIPNQVGSNLSNIPGQTEDTDSYYLDLKTKKRIRFKGEMVGWIKNHNGIVSGASIENLEASSFSNRNPCYVAYQQVDD
jgi:filamentous hemagglutinin family protein